MNERLGLAGLFTLALIACGGAAAGPAGPTTPVSSTPTCSAGSAWNGTQCQVFAERISARAPTPFTENGRSVSLEVIVYRPLGAGPFPTVLFHHGSTGNGTDPSLFTQTYTSENIAQFFASRGWLVAFAQRRGRGASDGLYDEGFTPDRSRYTCDHSITLAGFERALSDIDAAVAYISSRPDVIPTSLLSAGVSRGGVLAMTHAAERPGVFLGAVNFVGGWLGEGCPAPSVNPLLFERAARFSSATIWMYGENDPFYSVNHSRGNFSTFMAAGGQGTFHVYTRGPGLSGHNIINDPHLWSGDLQAFMEALK
jgi:dienelactone hydrolase